MTSTIGTLEQVDNDAPSPASAGSHRFSFSSLGAPQITDPSGNTTVLGSKFLPIVFVPSSQPAPPGKTYYPQLSGITLQLPLGHDGDTFSVFAERGKDPITIAASGAEQIQNDGGNSVAAIVLPATIGSGSAVFYTWTFTPIAGGIWLPVSRQEYPPNRQRGGLPTVVHGGGPLAAQSNTAYRVTADGSLTLPVGLVLGTVRVAFVKDYAGAGPTLLASGGLLTDSTTGLPVAAEILTTYGPGTRLEYAYDDTASRWQLTAKVPF